MLLFLLIELYHPLHSYLIKFDYQYLELWRCSLAASVAMCSRCGARTILVAGLLAEIRLWSWAISMPEGVRCGRELLDLPRCGDTNHPLSEKALESSLWRSKTWDSLSRFSKLAMELG